MNKSVWHKIFYPHKYYSHIDKIAEKAREVDYPLFCWNGRIYKTDGTFTELTVEDLELK